MRKMKKINGYLVVRFNDREKRERPELGNFGVIDAELYSGNLLVDLDAMEYTDADLIEVAMEQARGLDSEFDMEEPEVQLTIVKDVDGVTSEESYNPVQMFDITRTLLAGDIQRGMGEDIDPRTAAHELRGFVKALTTMGVVRGDDERFYVALDSFGPPEADIPLSTEQLRGMIGEWVWVKVRYRFNTCDGWAFVCTPGSLAFFEQSLPIDENGKRFTAYRYPQKGGPVRLPFPQTTKAAAAEAPPGEQEDFPPCIWNEVCKHWAADISQRELDAVREKCKADKRADSPPPAKPCCDFRDDGYQSVQLLTGEGLAEMSPHDFVEQEVIEGCTVQVLRCRKCGYESFAWFKPGKEART